LEWPRLRRSRASSNGCAQVKISGYGVIPWYTIWLIRFGRLKVAKKSKKAKRGGPARKKKGMKRAKPAKRAKAKKRAPKPAPAPMAPSEPAPTPPPPDGMTASQ